MIQRLQIENFRGLRQFDITSFKRVNLIAGANNVGKSALLECIFFALHNELEKATDWFPRMVRPAPQDEDAARNFWEWTFSDHDTTKPVHIRATGEGFDHDRWISAKTQPAGPGQFEVMKFDNFAIRTGDESNAIPPGVTVFTNSGAPNPVREAIDYNRVVLRRGGEERLLALLRKMEPRLAKIRALQVARNPYLFADIGFPELIPVTQMGQGFSRLLSIYAEMVVADKGVVLIDEVENGIHHAVLRDVWQGLTALAQEEDVQIFATTHSWECIRAAHLHFAETLDYDFALHRLDRTKEGVKLVTYDREMLESALQAELEVR